MELQQRNSMSSDVHIGSDFGNSSSANPRKRKIIVIACVAVIAFLVVIVGYFTARSYSHANDEGDLLAAGSSIALPSIRWEGTCPRNASKCPQSYQSSPLLILVSLDGFHPDYLNRGITPTLNQIAQCGVKADFMYPVFPSKTFPNHYSIVTGLNPPSHGIVDNSMYDPLKRTIFKVGSPEMYQSYWYQKEPIWVTAGKQGLKTASFYWVGSEVKDISPTYYKKYVSRTGFNTRVDQVLQWIDLPAGSRPSFITLYVNQPDNAAHSSGTKSKQTNQAIKGVDQMIARLYAGLQRRNLIDCVNVIILSDHGMSDIDCKNVVDIQRYMDVSQVYVTAGPFGKLRPKGRRTPDSVAEVISKLRCKSEHMRVYPKEQLPVRMHFADNARIEPIFLDMDNGWTIVSKGVRPGDEICTGGAHGYDNLYHESKAIFMANGPSIKKGVTIKPFINTELYELLCELIHITPNPNNGTKGSLHHILKSPIPLLLQAHPDPPALGYVPEDEQMYNSRVLAANCTCPQPQKQIGIVNNEILGKNVKHLPFGVPYSSSDNTTLRLLYNEDYILAFDLKYRIPMWTSFTLAGKKDLSNSEDHCWIGDARISGSDTANCGDYSSSNVKKQYILQRPLYPPDFSDSSVKVQASYITNAIPKSLNHTNILEKKLNQLLSEWATQEGDLNVVMGPAFDLLATGIRPDIGKMMRKENYGRLIVPTHIYVVATWCSIKENRIKDCIPSELEAQAFLLPNSPFPNNCEPSEKIIQNNVARIVDVEKLTGISFFTKLPTYDAIRLRTDMPVRSVS